MDGNTTGRPDDGPSGLRATVVEFVDDHDQCTIYPADVGEGRQVTTWISARGDAFVDPREYC